MSFLSRLFGSRSPSDEAGSIDDRLDRLEKEAERATPAYVGTAFNRAGDLALRNQRRERAVVFYGRAIDAFLEDGQREAARGVANKIIRVRPEAVRTLCTLTWLDLAARHDGMALLHLREYVRAAEDADEHRRAATQLYEMARCSSVPEFLSAVADGLDALGYERRAEEVRGWVSEGAPAIIDDPDELADACFTAAVRSNDPDMGLLRDDGAGSGRSPADPGVGGESSGAPDREGGAGGGDDAGHPQAGKRRYRWE